MQEFSRRWSAGQLWVEPTKIASKTASAEP